jgi:hypothetical protein
VPSNFLYAPNKYWSEEENQLERMDQVAEKLKVKHMDSWHTVPEDLVAKNGGLMVLYVAFFLNFMLFLVNN